MSNMRERLIAKNDRSTETMLIPEWGETIEIRSMSGKMRDRYIDTVMGLGLTEESDTSKVGALVLPLMPEMVLDGVYDPETGEKVFLAGDLDILREKNPSVIDRIAKKVIELSALGEKAVDEAGKPSSVTLSDDSTSA